MARSLSSFALIPLDIVKPELSARSWFVLALLLDSILQPLPCQGTCHTLSVLRDFEVFMATV